MGLQRPTTSLNEYGASAEKSPYVMYGKWRGNVKLRPYFYAIIETVPSLPVKPIQQVSQM